MIEPRPLTPEKRREIEQQREALNGKMEARYATQRERRYWEDTGALLAHIAVIEQGKRSA